MYQGQQFKDDKGNDVALFPDVEIEYAPHTDYVAFDLGGKQLNVLYAPTKLKVGKCDQSNQWHEAYFFCYGLTPKFGLTKFTMLAMHDNDVSDLVVGKEFEQGQEIYREGGFGPSGAKTYASHIHLQVCVGHTTQKVKNSLGKWTLKNAIPINEIFYANDAEIITKGLEWSIYELPKPVEPVAEPIIEKVVEPITEEVKQIVEPIQEPVVVSVVETVSDPIPNVPTNEENVAQTENTVAQQTDQKTENVGQETETKPVIEQETPVETSQNATTDEIKPLESDLPKASVNTSSKQNTLVSALIAFIIYIIKLLGKRK